MGCKRVSGVAVSHIAIDRFRSWIATVARNDADGVEWESQGTARNEDEYEQ